MRFYLGYIRLHVLGPWLALTLLVLVSLGAILTGLRSRVQAIAVTHAPQVAARADRHFVIAKDALDKGKRVATRVNALAADLPAPVLAELLGLSIATATRWTALAARDSAEYIAARIAAPPP